MVSPILCDGYIRKICWLRLLFVVFLVHGTFFGVRGQEIDSDSTVLPSVSIERPKFTPILAPSYSPEVELMINLGGLLTFKVKPLDSLLQRSSIPFSIGYSTNQSLLVNFRPFIYGKNDNVRLYGDIWVRDMPDNYWGVGYDAGKRTSEPDSTTMYQRNWWQVNLSTVFKVIPDLFVGFNLDLNQTNPSNVNPFMQQDPIVQEFGDRIRNSGLGLIIQYDTRDVAVNAYSGIFLSLTSSFYGEFFNGENKYNIFKLDYRQYKQIKRSGSTLVWQVVNRFGTGSVPWTEMSQLGSPFDLRGYRWGRFRDINMLFGIVEYRHMFMRRKPSKSGRMISRSGLVTWVATGTITPEKFDPKNWLPNVGVGFRFEVQPRMNARVDIGFGEDSNSFYVSFNEAF